MQDPDGQRSAPRLTRLMAGAWPAAEQVELGQPPRFQVSDRDGPPEPGGLLRRRGYREDAPTEVWVSSMSGMTGLRGGGWDLCAP